MRHPIEMAALKGPVDAVEVVEEEGAVGVVGVSEVRRLTRFAEEEAPRREGALAED